MAGAGDLEGLLAVGDDGTPERSAPTAKTNGLPVTRDGDDLAGLGARASGVERGLEAGDALGPEGVRPGVVLAVVEGDERQGAHTAGEGDVLHGGAGDDLGGQSGWGRCVVVVRQASVPSVP